MSPLGETLATALLLSGLAAACLALLPRTPPQIRFGVAVAGLAAWVVPWGLIRIALPQSSAAVPLVDWLGTAQSWTPLATPEWGQTYFPPKISLSPFAGYFLATAFVVGLVLFLRDCLALRRCLRGWHARSRCGEVSASSHSVNSSGEITAGIRSCSGATSSLAPVVITA